MNHYQILRLQPEIDIHGISEDEISRKIEINMADILNRMSKMGKSKDAIEKETAQLNRARDVLIDPIKRAAYDEQLKNQDEDATVTFVFVSPEEAKKIKTQNKSEIEWLEIE